MNEKDLIIKKNIFNRYRILKIINVFFFIISFILLRFSCAACEQIYPHSKERETLMLLKKISLDYFSFIIIIQIILIIITVLIYLILRFYRKKHKDIIDYWTVDEM